MRRILAALALLLLLQSPASAAGQLVVLDRFSGGGNEFDFDQYTEIGGKDRIAVVAIEIGHSRSSVAFDAKEWHSFAELWQKAKNLHAATWQPVGDFKETGVTAAATLSVAAGPGVQFTITGGNGPFTFVLMPADYPRFDAAVKHMTEWTAP